METRKERTTDRTRESVQRGRKERCDENQRFHHSKARRKKGNGESTKREITKTLTLFFLIYFRSLFLFLILTHCHFLFLSSLLRTEHGSRLPMLDWYLLLSFPFWPRIEGTFPLSPYRSLPLSYFPYLAWGRSSGTADHHLALASRFGQGPARLGQSRWSKALACRNRGAFEALAGHLQSTWRHLNAPL